MVNIIIFYNNRFTRKRTSKKREVFEIEFRDACHRAKVCRLSRETGTSTERKGSEIDSIRGGYRARSREGSKNCTRRRRNAKERIVAGEDNGSAAENSLRQTRLLHRYSVAAV